ncbi:MAG: PAS domain-containing protein [Spirochaetales bacterium]
MTDHHSSSSPEAILEALRVHQVELQMQNEELRRIQAELDASRSLYFDLYELAPVGYCTVSPDGLIVQANLTSTTLLGLRRGDLVQHRFSQFMHSDDLDAFYRVRRQVLAEGRAGEVEVRLLRPSEQSFWAHLTMTRSEQDPEGQVRIVLSDISVRRAAEESVLLGYHTLLAVSQGVIVTGPDRLVRSVNQAFIDMTGYAQQDIVGRNCRLLQGPLSDAAQVESIRRALAGGKGFVGEILNYRKDGTTFWNDLLINEVCNADGVLTHYVGVIRDVTEKRAQEATRLSLERQLMQSQKMESLGLLAGGVAHDINNTLAAISAVGAIQLVTLPPESVAFRAFTTIEKAVRRGAETVASLLNFSRKKPAETKPLDWNALIREQLNLLKHTTMARVEVRTQLEPFLQTMEGDSGSLGLALMNLCLNSLDALGPTVTAPTITLSTRNDGAFVAIEVADNGVGMDAEVLSRALDPFYTTKPVGKGTGLGLSMVYSVVQAHRGTLNLDSSVGQGTRVTLTFPASSLAVPTPAPHDPTSALSSLPPLHVMLVDDDEIMRDSCLGLLEALGTQPVGYGSGEAALAALGSQPFDLVLLDMNMPGLGGPATLAELRRREPDLWVLVVTGLADQAVLDLLERTPCTELMAKPFEFKTLQNTLAQHALRLGACRT